MKLQIRLPAINFITRLASDGTLKLHYSPCSKIMECSIFNVNKNTDQAVKRHHFHISQPNDKEQTI